MPIRHQLSLDVIDTGCAHNLKISDTSAYAEHLPADCQRLAIWLPGFANPVYIPHLNTRGFITSLTALDLGLQPQADAPLRDLPDGLYKVQYSVSPNEHVLVEYHHLRTTKTTLRLLQELCKVQLSTCEPDADQHRKLHELREIDQFLRAAKAKVEVCHTPVQGLQLLEYAQKLLANLQTGKCLHC